MNEGIPYDVGSVMHYSSKVSGFIIRRSNDLTCRTFGPVSANFR